jgi:hypothetical protein
VSRFGAAAGISGVVEDSMASAGTQAAKASPIYGPEEVDGSGSSLASFDPKIWR